MNSFDSAFEALALHYVGFGLFTVVNNVWTIVALVTAALSFWRLRAASLPLPLPLPSDRRLVSSPEAPDSRPSCSPIPESAEEATTAPIHPSPNVPAAPPACDADVATKGRFVTYYREEDRGDAFDGDEEAELSGDRRWLGDRAGEWWEGWEKALRLRSNGAERGRGWYDYQDRAVLSGSVVRLWEEERWELVVASSVKPAGRCRVVVW
ncbi:hypothetical protein MLD38_014234 [Melastoma candidum]|uniref:Uncharacterized protein n=1 Tax=Melastoma candidum TaxID=119954 RepID=A0ACB9RKJ6_9MYRT|nr:hypothetical protein MLD38_014234 [Melastoma candidum]